MRWRSWRAGRTRSWGAGTILEADQVKEAYDAGAEFIVTPIVAPEVVEAANDLSMPVALGASTPTEIFTARRAGADWVKVFPGESLGGPNYIAQVLGPAGTPDPGHRRSHRRELFRLSRCGRRAGRLRRLGVRCKRRRGRPL